MFLQIISNIYDILYESINLGAHMNKKYMYLFRKYFLLCYILTLLAFACAQVNFIPTGNSYEPWEGSVKILDELPSDVRYEEVGVITGKMSGMVSDWGKILKAMQKKARAKGANAIILINKETSSQSSFGGSLKYGFYGGSYQEKNMMARLIRILDDPERPNQFITTPVSSNKYLNIIKVVDNYCLIDSDNPKAFQIGKIYEIVRVISQNHSKVGMAKVVRIKGNNIAFQIIDGSVQINDKVKYIK